MFYSVMIIDLLTSNWTFKWFPKVHVNAQNGINTYLLCLWLFVVCKDPQKSRDTTLFPTLYTRHLCALQNVHPSMPSTTSYHRLVTRPSIIPMASLNSLLSYGGSKLVVVTSHYLNQSLRHAFSMH